MKANRILLLAAIASLSACMTPPAINLKTSSVVDPAAAKAAKRVAVMPFFNANALGTDDPDPAYKGKFSEVVGTTIVFKGVKEVGRFDLVPMENVEAALKKNGFKGIDMSGDPGIMTFMMHPDRFRTGMTMQQALKAGRQLDADAVLVGSYGAMGATGGANGMRYVMSMRLLDSKSGKVLWGGARSEQVKASLLHPLDTYAEQMKDLAKTLIAEVP